MTSKPLSTGYQSYHSLYKEFAITSLAWNPNWTPRPMTHRSLPPSWVTLTHRCWSLRSLRGWLQGRWRTCPSPGGRIQRWFCSSVLRTWIWAVFGDLEKSREVVQSSPRSCPNGTWRVETYIHRESPTIKFSISFSDSTLKSSSPLISSWSSMSITDILWMSASSDLSSICSLVRLLWLLLLLLLTLGRSSRSSELLLESPEERERVS